MPQKQLKKIKGGGIFFCCNSLKNLYFSFPNSHTDHTLERDRGREAKGKEEKAEEEEKGRRRRSLTRIKGE